MGVLMMEAAQQLVLNILVRAQPEMLPKDTHGAHLTTPSLYNTIITSSAYC